MFGAEHFYLIDNNSTDDYMLELRPYMDRGIVELYHCVENGYQIRAYQEILPVIKDQCEWLGVFDLDEFIYSIDGTITDILDGFPNTELLLAPWLSFGSGGHVSQPPSIIDGFVRRGDAGVSRSLLKPICRPETIVHMSQHNPITRNGIKRLTNGEVFGDDLFINLTEGEVKNFCIVNNHYRLQSLDYFRSVKAARPEVNESTCHRTKSISFFLEFDDAWNMRPDRRLADIRAARVASSAKGG